MIIEAIVIGSCVVSVVSALTSIGSAWYTRQMVTRTNEDNEGVNVHIKDTNLKKKNGSELHTVETTYKLDSKKHSHESDASSHIRTGLPNDTARDLAQGGVNMLQYALPSAPKSPALTPSGGRLSFSQMSEQGDMPTSLPRYEGQRQGLVLYTEDASGYKSPALSNKPYISTSNKSSPNVSPHTSPQSSPSASSSSSSSPYTSKKDLNIGFKREAPSYATVVKSKAATNTAPNNQNDEPNDNDFQGSSNQDKFERPIEKSPSSLKGKKIKAAKIHPTGEQAESIAQLQDYYEMRRLSSGEDRTEKMGSLGQKFKALNAAKLSPYASPNASPNASPHTSPLALKRELAPSQCSKKHVEEGSININFPKIKSKAAEHIMSKFSFLTPSVDDPNSSMIMSLARGFVQEEDNGLMGSEGPSN